MMAAKKGFNWVTFAEWGGALLVAWYVWMWLRARAATASPTGAGGVYGNYGASPYTAAGLGYNPYTNPYNAASQQGFLSNLLNSLFKPSSAGGGGGSSAKGGSGASAGSPAGAASYSALQNAIAAIGGFNRDAINAPNFADLGGQSLANYSDLGSLAGASGLSDYQIASVPGNYQFDVSQSATPVFDLSGVSYNYDPTEVGGGFADVQPIYTDYTIDG